MSDREQFQEARTAGLKARHETRQERAIRRQVHDEVLRGYHSMLCNSDVPDWTLSGELDAVTDAILRMLQPAAIRRDVAEEIALALETEALSDYDAADDLRWAAAKAREIGSKEAP